MKSSYLTPLQARVCELTKFQIPQLTTLNGSKIHQCPFTL